MLTKGLCQSLIGFFYFTNRLYFFFFKPSCKMSVRLLALAFVSVTNNSAILFIGKITKEKQWKHQNRLARIIIIIMVLSNK